MLPYEIKVEWYTQMYYNNKQVATEVIGSKIFYDKSPAYIAGYCQHFSDKGYKAVSYTHLTLPTKA